jgi:hypothetical protein
MVTNASFDGGLTGYSTTSSWQFNQTLDQSVVGTVYNIRTAVQNPAAAPSGSDAAAYPVASLNAFGSMKMMRRMTALPPRVRPEIS